MPCSRAANSFTVATACTGGPCATVGVEEKRNHINMTNKTNYAPYIPQTMMHGSFMTSIEDEKKTTFITPFGVFCYVKMPFGL
uniref:Uncharacterized protein n=1 Tax=Oryza barthii TaxID=65489 RepID=A0A0D3EQY5_9ORYZ